MITYRGAGGSGVRPGPPGRRHCHDGPREGATPRLNRTSQSFSESLGDFPLH